MDVWDEYLRAYAGVMTLEDVAEVLGVPRSTTVLWARQGMLPARKHGRTWLVDRAAFRVTMLAARNLPLEDSDPTRETSDAEGGTSSVHAGWDWLSWCERFTGWVEANGRLPARVAPGSVGEKTELSLYLWLLEQRRKAAGGELDAGQLERLSVVPGWREGGMVAVAGFRWRHSLRLCAAFVEEQGRLPELSAVRDAGEARLARWLAVQRMAFHKNALEPYKKNALDGAVPGWNERQKSGPKPRPHSAHDF